jgi:arylsulfatase A-like enzyme
VPLIAWWPGQIAAGTTNATPCALWDFLPTAAEIAGVAVPENLDGRSWLPALRGKAMAPREYLYWEFHEGGFRQAVRVGDWKAVRGGEAIELFNLASDPAESKDVAAEQSEVLKRIETIFREARTESDLWPTGKKKE